MMSMTPISVVTFPKPTVSVSYHWAESMRRSCLEVPAVGTLARSRSCGGGVCKVGEITTVNGSRQGPGLMSQNAHRWDPEQEDVK